MPTSTFLKLNDEKRDRFIEVALQEFAHHNFDAASINRIVKELGIARGSVYQYFKDKLELWLYLYEYAQQQKLAFITVIDRAEFDDFWMYYRTLYKNGIHFEVHRPDCYAFLYRAAFLERSPSVVDQVDEWQQQAKIMLSSLVKMEQQTGNISTAVSVDIAVALMMATSRAIADLWREQVVSLDTKEKEGEMTSDALDRYYAIVDEAIDLLAKALK